MSFLLLLLLLLRLLIAQLRFDAVMLRRQPTLNCYLTAAHLAGGRAAFTFSRLTAGEIYRAAIAVLDRASAVLLPVSETVVTYM